MTREPVTPNQRLYAGAVLYGLVALTLVLMIAALVYLVQNAENGAATRRLLVECVIPPEERVPPVDVSDPEGDCYTRGVARQGKAVGQIGDLSILAATCGAAHPGDVAATRACVEQAMKG